MKLPTESLEQKVNRYLSIYTDLKKALKWKITDNKTVMLTSIMYVVNNRKFELERFQRISDYIKSSVGSFNTLRSSQRFSIASMLDIRFENVEDVFQSYLDLYETLIKGGFKRGMFTYITAGVIFTSDKQPSDYDELIEKAHSVYKAMKGEHLFLTSESDYPLAVLLALRNEDTSSLMEHIEGFYDHLNNLGLRKGNDLQFLSHILSLDLKGDRKILSDRCMQIFDRLTQLSKKPKTMHYPSIGMLAMCEPDQLDLTAVTQLTERLNSEKEFKWQKDLNFMLAVHLVMSEITEDATLSNTGMMTTLEIIMQAQQAAMIASMGAVAAASASNS
jgi:hypothetical protein